MPLSNAEKQRRYREKRDADPGRRQAYLNKEKQKYQQDKQSGRRKLVEDMTKREHRMSKRKWREYKRTVKKRQVHLENQVTPPLSPDPTSPQIPVPSRQKLHANKVKRRQKSSLERKIYALQSQLEQERRRAAMYRKRLQRTKNEDTPRSKTRKQLRNISTKTVRKTLLFHNVLIDQMKETYKSGPRKQSQVAQLLRGNILRKYMLKVYAEKQINCFARQRSDTKYKSLSRRLEKSVHTFFVRDDVSRITTGLKNTVTRHKVKRQKRLLNDTMVNLHKKFCCETSEKISYKSFTRLRPFWVMAPSERDRKTCLCKTCENVTYMSKKLQDLKLMPRCGLQSLTKMLVCDVDSKTCMYGLCPSCSQKQIIEKPPNATDTVTWLQWRSYKESRLVRGNTKDITLTSKVTIKDTIEELVNQFHDQIRKYCHHAFNIAAQFRHYRNLRESLQNDECLIHIDFSENYEGKLSAEIQSMHFGGSKTQITLHTGAYFIKNGGHSTCSSFCTVSDSLQHGPAAIWVHLKPILVEIREKHPQVEKIHFFSDGPCTQYKQKRNFYLFSKNIFEMGFRSGTWNFHESAHGKGIPDGIGGTLKRMADLRVRHGKDIVSARSFVEELKSDTSIRLEVVGNANREEEILKSLSLKPIPGTMGLHQIIVPEPGLLYYRDVSCTCAVEKPCVDHEVRIFNVEGSQEGRKRPVKRTQVREAKGVKRARRDCSPDISDEQAADIDMDTDQQVGVRIGEGQEQADEIFEEEREQGLIEQANVRVEEGEKESVQDEQATIPSHNFNLILESLQACSDFASLQKQCGMIVTNEIQGSPRSVTGDTLTVDQNALDIYPDDVPGEEILFTTDIRADGDCLPSAGSLFAFGNQNRSTEIRARIVMELATHQQYYLSQNYLQAGIESPAKLDLCKTYAMFSEKYVPGIILTKDTIKTIYEQEVLNIRTPRTYMGIWQLFGLASVLQMPIFSIYPKLGNPNVRRDLHRLILPRIQKTSSQAHIMWSTTRMDMTNRHWVPNHFVCAVEVDSKNKQNLKVVGGECGHEKGRLEDEKIVGGQQAGAKYDDGEDACVRVWEEREQAGVIVEVEGEQASVRVDKEEQIDVTVEVEGEPASVRVDKEEQIDVTVEEGREQACVRVDKEEQIDVTVEEGREQASVRVDKEEQIDVTVEEGREQASVRVDKEEQIDVTVEEGREQAGVRVDKEEQAGVRVEEKGGKENMEDEKGKMDDEEGEKVCARLDEDGEKAGARVDKEGEKEDMRVDKEDHAGIKVGEEGEKESIQEEKGEKAGVPEEEAGEKVDMTAANGKQVVSLEAVQKSQNPHNQIGLISKMQNGIDIESLVGQYVVVLYDGVLYPGSVLEAGKDDVYCLCMRKVGGKKSENCFYWPKKIKDKCWYLTENILAIIPKPKPIESCSSHFCIDFKIWEELHTE